MKQLNNFELTDLFYQLEYVSREEYEMHSEYYTNFYIHERIRRKKYYIYGPLLEGSKYFHIFTLEYDITNPKFDKNKIQCDIPDNIRNIYNLKIAAIKLNRENYYEIN